LNNILFKIEVRCIRGKTMHDGALVIIAFMWSLSILRWLLSL
jgi:hypothetical protein